MNRIGFLPLYLELYDLNSPKAAQAAREYAARAAQSLQESGLEIISAPVCRLQPEFKAAVRQFEKSDCDCIVTLHLAYSPSLEAIDALAETHLPLVMMDTTPDAVFSAPSTQIMANHGIHGVQDLGNLLLRREKPFLVAAGEFDEQLLGRVKSLVQSAAMACKMQRLRIGRAGGTFAGMGDFQFEPGSIGIEEVTWNNPGYEPGNEEILAEMSLDKKRFQIDGPLDEEAHRRITRDALRIRAWIESEKLDAFTICFTGLNRAGGWTSVPFLECSKAMARGIGYAGEGDTLTAGLHAAVFRGFPECGFSEMFCPDWQGNRIFTSHMGEINLAVTTGKPLLKIKPFKFTDAEVQGAAFACMKPGNAVWLNLAPQRGGRFRLIAGEIEFLPPPEAQAEASFNAGWFRPKNGDISGFLEKFTHAGGTHHGIVVYGGNLPAFADFASLMGWDFLSL